MASDTTAGRIPKSPLRRRCPCPVSVCRTSAPGCHRHRCTLIGPSNSRPPALPQRCPHPLMHSIQRDHVLLSEAPAEVASRGRIRDQVRAQRIHVRRVMAQTLDVLQPCAATQNVVRKVQHVIRLMMYGRCTFSSPRRSSMWGTRPSLVTQPMHRGDAPEAHRVRVRPNLIVHRARVEHRLAPSVPVPCLAVSSSYLALAPGTVHAALIRRYSLHRKGLLRWIRGSHQEPTNSNKGKPFRFSFLGQSRQSRLLRD